MGTEKRSILIAGAGPVGLAAALELARRGFSPRIIDNGDGPTPLGESRALGVNARTLTLMSLSGATERILAEAQDIAHFRMRSHDRLLAEIDTHKVPGRFSALYGLAQGATERILLDVLACYGIVPEWNTAIETIASDAAKPRATLRRPDQSEETVSPDILIGADGAHSVVRKSLGFGFPGQALESYFYLADFRYAEPVDSHFAEIRLLNPGMLGRLPLAANVLRFISTIPDFEDRIEHPAAVAEKPWVSQFRIHFRHTEPMSFGNIFLAGDAAHIHSPAGARGMNLGIEDASWLAYLIAEGREQEYSARRIPVVKQVLKQTYTLTRLATMHNPIATEMRDSLAPLMLGFSPVRSHLLHGVSGYDTPKPPWIDWAE